MCEEAKGGKEIQYRIESRAPARGHLTHVTASVPELRASSALARYRKQFIRVIETVHIVSRLGQQMRVPALPAWDIEYARSYRKSKQLNEARRLLTIALGRE
jgi:hypothetical protein